MMLHGMELCADRLAWEGLSQQSGEARPGATIAEAAERQIDVGAPDQDITNLPHEVRTIVLIEGNVFEIGQLNTCLAQTI